MNQFVEEFSAVLAVMLAYFLLYYLFMAYGLVVKMKVAKRCRERGEPFLRYTGNYPEVLAADRVQLNTLEHMPPFLVLMWTQAFVVSPQSAAWLGSTYVFIRATYPLFLGRSLTRSFPKRVFLNTFSGYAVLTAFMVWQLITLVEAAGG